jgi:protein kinase A
VNHELTKKFYAVKIMAKESVVKSKQVYHTKNEKQILRAINFPFLVHLEFSLKDNSYLYMGMPFVNGGGMFTHLQKYGKVQTSVP